MRRSRHLAVAAALALAVVGGPSAVFAQQYDWAGPIAENSKNRDDWRNSSRQRHPRLTAIPEVPVTDAASGVQNAPDPGAGAPNAGAGSPNPGGSSGGGAGTSAPAAPAAPAATAAVPPAAPGPAVSVQQPSGLSHDAPESAPKLGVVGKVRSTGPSPAATPEPSTMLLMGTGLAALYRLRRRR